MKSLFSILLTAGLSFAEPHPVVLTFTSSSAKITGTNLANDSSDDIEYSLSGSLQAAIGLDSESGKPTSFEFTGGRFSFSDFEATGVLVILPVTVEARGLSGVPASGGPENSIDAATGILTPAHHFFDLNSGTLVFTNFFGVETARVDYSESPRFRNFSETMRVTSDLLKSSPLGKHYLITLRQDSLIDEEYSITSTTNVQLNGTSNSVAEGKLTVISEPAKEWASDTGDLEFRSFEDLNPTTGHPLAALFALGRRADGSPGLTLSEDGTTCHLTLPRTGTRLPVTVEYSPDLSIGSWKKITTEAVIPAGTNGKVSFPLPSAEGGFVRLRVDPL